MASSKAKIVKEYLEELEPSKRTVISAIRDMIVENLPDGFEEVMNWGMITYEVPLTTYEKTYNKKPLMNIALAAQKNYNSLYLMGIYMDDGLIDKLTSAFEREGLKLNMGKSCIRFKNVEDLPLSTIAEMISSITLDKFIKYMRAAMVRALKVINADLQKYFKGAAPI